MMEHCRVLFKRWGGGTAILSPRDSNVEQLARLSAEVRAIRGDVLLDPQFYLPHADHQRLTAHSFWPARYSTDTFFEGEHENMVKALVKVNTEIKSRAIIVPGMFADEVDDMWLASQRVLLNTVLANTRQPVIATVALSASAVKDDAQIHEFIDFAEEHPVPEYYLVLERESYIIDDPNWLINALDLVASLRRQNARVVVGYANQHALLAASAAANAIASGTFLNVRQFSGSKFEASEEEEIKRKSKWYYLPQALSEFKLPFLDLAFRAGAQDLLEPDPATPFAKELLDAPQPSASGWTETDAHRHYLEALKRQAGAASHDTFDATVVAHKKLLDDAEERLQELHAIGVLGQQRDFEDAIDAHRAALTVFEGMHGPSLRREWARFSVS